MFSSQGTDQRVGNWKNPTMHHEFQGASRSLCSTMHYGLVLAEQICHAAAELLLLLVIAVVVDYCFLLPMHMAIRCREYLRHTAAAQIAYKITRSRSIQVELEKVEDLRETLKAHCRNLKWMLASLNLLTTFSTDVPNNFEGETGASRRKCFSFSPMSARFTHRCLSVATTMVAINLPVAAAVCLVALRAWSVVRRNSATASGGAPDPGLRPSANQPSMPATLTLCAKQHQPDLLPRMPFHLSEINPLM